MSIRTVLCTTISIAALGAPLTPATAGDGFVRFDDTENIRDTRTWMDRERASLVTEPDGSRAAGYMAPAEVDRPGTRVTRDAEPHTMARMPRSGVDPQAMYNEHAGEPLYFPD